MYLDSLEWPPSKGFSKDYFSTNKSLLINLIVFETQEKLAGGGCGPNRSSSAGTSILSPGPNIILTLGGVYIGMVEI